MTEYGRFPTNKTYFWGRSLDGLGAGLSSDAGSGFFGGLLLTDLFGLVSPDNLGFFLLALAWFCDRGLLSSSCVIILVSVYIEGRTVSVLFLRPKKM